MSATIVRSGVITETVGYSLSTGKRTDVRFGLVLLQVFAQS